MRERSGTAPRRRLWIINQYAIPESAPGITRHATLARLMSEQDGFLVEIVAGRGHYWNIEATCSQGGLHDPLFRYVEVGSDATNGIRRVLNMLRFSLNAVWLGVRASPHDRPDVVLASSPHLFGGLAGWLLAKWFRVPFALEVRDLWPESLVQLLGLSRRHPVVLIMRRIERFLYRRAQTVFLLLPGSEGHVRAVARHAAPTVWVPNGIDLGASATGDDGNQIKAPQRSDARLKVTYAGAHGIPNALDVVIDAWAIIESRNSLPDVDLEFVGSGKEKANLQIRAERLGLKRVAFKDPIAKSQIPALLSDSAVLVMSWRKTSLYKHGISPNKLFDYMGAAKPVLIAVDTPLNPIELARSGVTVPPEDPRAMADGLEELFSLSESQLRQLGENGRRYVAEYHDLRTIATTMARTLDSLIVPGGSSSSL